MPFPITRGLGEIGDGSTSTLLSTGGYGEPAAGSFLSCFAFVSVAINALPNSLAISFTSQPTIAGPAADPTQYSITSLGAGQPVTVTAVQISGANLLITTTEHTDGEPYRLDLPVIGMVDTGYNPYQGAFLFNYNGAGIDPNAILARSIDARTLEIYFDEAVLEADAIIPANYSISPTLTVSAAVKVSDTIYRLTTSRQTLGQLYTVTVSNIRDLAGNYI